MSDEAEFLKTGGVLNDNTPPFDPIKLCCFRPWSEHAGVVCPDGLVMCCLCFGRFPIEGLRVNDEGIREDACLECTAVEQAQMLKLAHEGDERFLYLLEK